MAMIIPCFMRSDLIINAFRRDSKTVDDLIMSETSLRTRVNTQVVIKKIWIESLVIFAAFAITFMMYPSIVYQKSKAIVPGKPAWSLLILNSSECIADFIGRSIAKIRDSYSRTLLVSLSLSRIALISTTLIIALSDMAFWNARFVIILNVFILGLTNGFVATAACRTIPGRLENNEKEFGGFIMSLMINSGIFVGSFISLVGLSRIFSD
jgi:hypothetical protein